MFEVDLDQPLTATTYLRAVPTDTRQVLPTPTADPLFTPGLPRRSWQSDWAAERDRDHRTPSGLPGPHPDGTPPGSHLWHAGPDVVPRPARVGPTGTPWPSSSVPGLPWTSQPTDRFWLWTLQTALRALPATVPDAAQVVADGRWTPWFGRRLVGIRRSLGLRATARVDAVLWDRPEVAQAMWTPPWDGVATEADLAEPGRRRGHAAGRRCGGGGAGGGGLGRAAAAAPGRRAGAPPRPGSGGRPRHRRGAAPPTAAGRPHDLGRDPGTGPHRARSGARRAAGRHRRRCRPRRAARVRADRRLDVRRRRAPGPPSGHRGRGRRTGRGRVRRRPRCHEPGERVRRRRAAARARAPSGRAGDAPERRAARRRPRLLARQRPLAAPGVTPGLPRRGRMAS
nr:hypothetical protein [Angustibacter aerolatus]